MKKSTLLIAAVSLSTMLAHAQAVVPNGDMELWGQVLNSPEEPTNWVTSNTFANPLLTFPNPNPNPTSVFKAPSPNNYQGTYAMKIVTVDLAYNPDTATVPNRLGVAQLGSVTTTSPYLLDGRAYTSRPATVGYYAKYAPSGTDTAVAIALLTRWNSTTVSRDTIAFGFDYIPSALASYASRTINLDYATYNNNNFPDTLHILFSSSTFFTPQAGSTFYVDAVTVSGWVGMPENSDAANKVSVFPNPASSEVKFMINSDKASKIEVIDALGRTVKTLTIDNHKAVEQLYNYAAGMYTYTVLDAQNAVLNRGKFSVVK